jgi:hypothetical protein
MNQNFTVAKGMRRNAEEFVNLLFLY